MANLGDQAQHPGDVMRRLARIEADQRTQNAARRLESSAVGSGGIRIHQGGNLRIHDGGSITVEDGGNVNLTDGGNVRLVGGGNLETLQGTVPGELPGALAPFSTGNGRAALELYPSYSQGHPRDNSILIEGSTDANPTGDMWLFTGGDLQQAADQGISIEAQNDLHLDGRNQAFLNGDNDLHLLSLAGDINVNPDINLNANAGGAFDVDAGTSVDITAGGGDLIATSDTGNAFVQAPNGTVSIKSGNNAVFVDPGTSTDAANTVLSSNGQILMTSSSRRYKQDIADHSTDVDAVLRLRPRTWRDRAEVEQDPDTTRRIVGLIAEEVDALGLTEYIGYDAEGRPNSVAYDRLCVALLDVVQQQQTQLDELYERVTRLEGTA